MQICCEKDAHCYFKFHFLRLLVCRDEQDETISSLLEVGDGLARFGFHGDALWFSSHVELKGGGANLHRELDFSDPETETEVCFTFRSWMVLSLKRSIPPHLFLLFHQIPNQHEGHGSLFYSLFYLDLYTCVCQKLSLKPGLCLIHWQGQRVPVWINDIILVSSPGSHSENFHCQTKTHR